MENVRELAMFTVGRAVFFGALAISMVMLSFLFDLTLFFRSGAILAFALSAILVWYAQTAKRRHPKNTETWILLKKDQRPRNEHSVRAFCQVMEEVYTHYAKHVFAIACGLFAVSLIFSALGIHKFFS